MRVKATLKPGQRGTKRLVAKYGDRLVCVRYRYDERARRRYKTVELIVEEGDWEPREERIADDAVVGIRVDLREGWLQEKVKLAGGKWNRRDKVWELRYAAVVALGLEKRIVPSIQ